jgi:hypothetical protein
MHVLAPKGVPGAKGGKEEVLSHFTEEKFFESSPRYMQTKGETDGFVVYLDLSFVKSRILIRLPFWLICLLAVNVLDGFTLARIAGDDVIVNTINPGFCHSELTRDLNGLQALFIKHVIIRQTHLVILANQKIPW